MIDNVNKMLWIDHTSLNIGNPKYWRKLSSCLEKNINDAVLCRGGTPMIVHAVHLGNEILRVMRQWVYKPLFAIDELSVMMNDLIEALKNLEDGSQNVDLTVDLDRWDNSYHDPEVKNSVQRFYATITSRNSLIDLLRRHQLVSWLKGKQERRAVYSSGGSDCSDTDACQIENSLEDLDCRFPVTPDESCFFKANVLIDRMADMRPVPAYAVQRLYYLNEQFPEMVNDCIKNNKLVEHLMEAQRQGWTLDPLYGLEEDDCESEEEAEL